MSSFSHHDKQHVLRLLQQQGQVKNIFDDFVRRSGVVLTQWTGKSIDNVWIRNASLEKQIDKHLVELYDNLLKNIDKQTAEAWKAANKKSDEIIGAYIKDLALSEIVGKSQYEALEKGMFGWNMEALKAFQKRTINGIDVSKNVWNVVEGAKKNLEFYLSSGIATGRPAATISQDIRQLLNNPEKRFRRVRNDEGKLVLSKPMQAYHPGQGVYRSSRMNALRIAVTETNQAYHSADHERWKNQGFVLGIEVRRSASNKGPCEICDAMVGKYPKDYKFIGNHPFCICFAVPVMLEGKEYINYLINGEIPESEMIKTVPQGARDFVDRTKSFKESYTVRENAGMFVASAKNVKTAEQKADIQQRWNTRVASRKYDDLLGSIEEKYSGESKAIESMISNINAEIRNGKSIEVIDDKIFKLNHKVSIKDAWDARREENQLSTLLVDVKGLKAKYGIEQTKTIYNAVETKLATWENLSLAEQKKKLDFEIAWLEKTKKYETWQAAQSAYTKRLGKVDYLISKEKIQTDVAHALDYAKTTKSTKLKQLAEELSKSLNSDASISALETTAEKLNQEVARLEAEKLKRKGVKADWKESNYSQARKDAALWAKSPEEADNKVRNICESVWRNANDHEKLSAYRYTAGSSYINEPLRGANYVGQYLGKYDSQKDIASLTSIIDKSSYNFDIWIQRGVDGNGFKGVFNYDLSNKNVDEVRKSLLGRTGTEHAFSSCGNSKGAGFSSSEVVYNIYCPKGTKMLYAEPFSAFGNGAGKAWDGIAKQSGFGYEAEMILQRESTFRITKIEKNGSKWYIDVEVIGQK